MESSIEPFLQNLKSENASILITGGLGYVGKNLI